MSYQTITFEEVAVQGKKSGKCLCGKRRVRKVKFWATLNPFNKNADGSLKTREQLETQVRGERDAWLAKPIYCSTCQP